jgi:enamine deaminase RidA (YjgF/YER057c/UK114 family)
MSRNTPVRYLNPESLPKPAGYSHVVEAPSSGRLIHVSGQVGLDRTGKLTGEGDFRAQAVQAFENLKNALAAAGAGMEHLVKINMFVLDMSNPHVLREVRDASLAPDRQPASTLVEVSRFFRDDIVFEVDGTAVVSGS